MGAIFAERVLGVARPRVALLSIGEEKGKGDARIQRASELLDASGLRFERQRRGQGPDPPPGRRRGLRRGPRQRRDQVLRGPVGYIFDLWRDEFEGSLRGRLAYLLMRPGIGRIRGIFDYEKVGGSPLLGVRGTVIITHGRAKRRMVTYACEVAATTARTGVPALIAESLGGAGGGPLRPALPSAAGVQRAAAVGAAEEAS